MMSNRHASDLPTDDMRAYTLKSRFNSLVAVHVAEFEQPQRQLAIAALAALEDQAVHRAIHRLHVVRAVVHLHRRVHAVGIPLEVAGGFEHGRLGEMRCVHELVAAVLVAEAAVVLHQLADDRTFRVVSIDISLY